MNRTIGDIMERDAYTCRYDQDLGEVVALFNELGTSGLVVIDEDRHVVGFISDGDIMKAVAAQKTRSIFGGGYSNMVLYDNESFEEKARALKRRNVMELAVQRVLCATADQTIGEIADVLAKKRLKKVPVIDEDGRLIGSASKRSTWPWRMGKLSSRPARGSRPNSSNDSKRPAGTSRSSSNATPRRW